MVVGLCPDQEYETNIELNIRHVTQSFHTKDNNAQRWQGTSLDSCTDRQVLVKVKLFTQAH